MLDELVLLDLLAAAELPALTLDEPGAKVAPLAGVGVGVTVVDGTAGVPDLAELG